MKSAEKLMIVCFLFPAVLCRDFSITLPESVEALRGLCVLVTCTFEIKEQHDSELNGDPTGIWLKDGIDVHKNTVVNSKVTKGNKIEGQIIGDLLKKNCTTVFYNIRDSDRGKYYFRIEALGGLKYTYSSPSVSISVRDSPISPSITLYKEDQGKVEDQHEVVEGTSVSLICSASAPPCPYHLSTFTWNFLPEDRRQEQNHDTRFSSSQLNFTVTHLHHEVNFTCTVTYQLQNNITKSAHRSLTLYVLYGPRNTSVSVSPSSSVLLGSSVSLSCSSDANPAVLNYTWYRENGEQIGTGDHLTINMTDSTHSGLYYCRAQNQYGEHNSSVYLNVQYAPRVSPSSSCNTTQDLIVCSCEVHGNPSPELEWHLSVKDTPTLQCIGSNDLGIASQAFSFITKDQCSLKEHRHTVPVPYLVLSLSGLLLLSGAVIGFLIYKLKILSKKIKVLQRGDTYASLQLSAVQNSDYETLQTNRERRENKNNN